MKKVYLSLFVSLIFSFISLTIMAQSEKQRQAEADNSKKVNTSVDNNKYWILKAEQGLAELNPMREVPAAVFTGSKINAFSVVRDDSPDVPVTTENSTQSENSVFVNPNDPSNVLNSNNSSTNPVTSFYGANDLYSFDGGENWEGELAGAGGPNSGDPVALIGNNGWYYVGYITNGLGQGISYSQDQGDTWSSVVIANAPGGGILDKNHMWIDNSFTSPYEGNLYDAWTSFGGANDNKIVLAHSTDDGLNWSSGVNISNAVSSGNHDQGVNIKTGPNGEVYAAWSIYDSWPSDETAIGMARSFDGGTTWEPATRIIQNIRGIRTSETSKNQRVNSFPAMAVDVSGGDANGNIYIVWTNIGVPGINNDPDMDVYISRSEDQGLTWTDAVKVNQDEAGLGKQHYFPWITCDPGSGTLSVIFYDDRNVAAHQCEVYCANSYDAGETWEDFKVSDVSFTPTPIPGLASGYMGDYLGIDARDGMVYPVWCDNRTGTVMSYVSPFETNPLPRPSGLTGEIAFETGNTTLNWSFDDNRNFSHFNIYRDNEPAGTTTDTFYVDALPDYGIYKYSVTAFFDPDGESSASHVQVQWGDAHIFVDPDSISAMLLPDNSTTKILTVINTGQLELDYEITPFIISDKDNPNRGYCDASGGNCDEYIQRVQLGSIDHSSSCDGYEDNTELSTIMLVGDPYELTVTNGSIQWPTDQFGVWIDWNQNEDFTDDEPIMVNGSPGAGPYTATITPPSTALSGSTRMRVRIVYAQTPVPCGNTTYGEVEDYTIDVLSWLRPSPISGVVPAGDTAYINVELDANGLETGNYEAELKLYSNDPDNPEVIVPVNLLVTNYAVIATAQPDTLCIGGSTQLSTEVFGGSGSNTYTWSSIPPGFSSDEANPLITPDSTTTYIVQVTDNTLSAEDRVRIQVNPLPEVDLGDDRKLCTGDSISLNAGDHTTYFWSTGDTTATVYVFGEGWYWVEVTNEYGCPATDSLFVTEYPYPVVNLGQDTVLCYYHEIELNAGNPGASYIWSTGATTQTIIVDTTGMILNLKNIWVEVTNGGICLSGDTVHISFNECLGIYENMLSGIRIYPNPNSGTFYVEGNAIKKTIGDIQLINTLGATVYESTQSINSGLFKLEINTSALKEGIYTLRIVYDNQVISRKIVIRR